MEQVTKNATGETEDVVPCFDIPAEVLGNHLFKYFCFSDWLSRLILVNKTWYIAAQISRLEKQIPVQFFSDKPTVIGHWCRIASRYKVNTIILSQMGSATYSTLSKILNASPLLRTVVIKGTSCTSINWREYAYPTRNGNRVPEKFLEPKFEKITTLAISKRCMPLLEIFPNVTRLKLEGNFDHVIGKTIGSSYPKITELEVHTTRYDWLEKFLDKFPALKTMYINYQPDDDNMAETAYAVMESLGQARGISIHCRNSHLKEIPFDLSATSYYQFYHAFDCTPLVYLAQLNKDTKLRELVQSKHFISAEYELELRARQRLFTFPTLSPSFRRTRGSKISKKRLDSKTAAVLMELDLLDYWTKLRFLDKDKALEHLKSASKHLPPPSSVWDMLLRREDPILAGDALLRTLLDTVGPLAFGQLIQVQNKRGNTVVHTLEQMSCAEDWAVAAPHINWTEKMRKSLNMLELNPARFNMWKTLVLNGARFNDHLTFDTAKMEEFVRLLSEEKDRKLLDMLGPTFIENIWQLTSVARLSKEMIGTLLSFSARPAQLTIFNYFLVQYPSSIDVLNTMREVLQIDYNVMGEHGKTPLIAALDTTRSDIVDFVLSEGADPNFGGTGHLPLFDLCATPHVTEMFFVNAVNSLIAHGADINYRGDFDKLGKVTPIMLSVKYGTPTEYLMQVGADPSVADDAGNTLLHLVTEPHEKVSSKKTLNQIKLLSRYIDINAPNAASHTPLHCAILKSMSSQILRKFIECGADVNRVDQDGCSALILAARTKSTRALKVILAQPNVDLTVRDKHGHSFVHYLLHSGSKCRKLLDNVKFMNNIKHLDTPKNIVFVINELKDAFSAADTKDLRVPFKVIASHVIPTEFLIETVGLDVNTQDAHGRTLLLSINASRSPAVLNYLVAKGAGVDQQSSDKNALLMQTLAKESMDTQREL